MRNPLRPEVIGHAVIRGVAAVSEVGVLGDPTTATREDGARILAAMVADCARLVERWSPGADGMLT